MSALTTNMLQPSLVTRSPYKSNEPFLETESN